ncbi:hypothetical protein ABT124_34135 [Streptomyces sp. NPDC001982]|uniref:hypothetical protein n=1 Tax=Streptomyces sp. NPDC001982 TaxID=3154405 RepID=UPI003327343B
MSKHDFPMRGELDCEFRSEAAYADVVRGWIDGAVAEVYSAEVAEILDGAPLNPEVIRRGGVPCGPPGSMWGFCSTTVRASQGRGQRSYSRVISAKNLAWFREKIAAGPLSATLAISRLGPGGFPQDRLARITVERAEGAESWVRMSCEFPEHLLGDEQFETRFVRFLKSQAGTANPSFGQVAYNYTLGETALETVLGPPWLLPRETVTESRTFLRGYDWITVCPEELSSGLDLDALVKDGHFYEAERLSRGGVWLRAAARFSGYGPAQVRGMWDALAPLLRPGIPLRFEEEPDRPPVPVIYEDAASVTPVD